MRRSRFRLLLLSLMVAFVMPAQAHVGSKDVFEQVTAGPYKLFVTIRMPSVIPGVATIEARSIGSPVDSLRITPMPLTGEASKHPPTPDVMKRSADDSAFFTGSVWMMAQGSWQVRFAVMGSAGAAEASVPVAAMPLTVLRMQRPLGLMLALLGVVLVLGFAGIVGAAVRESRLLPGDPPSPSRRRRAVMAMGGAFVFIVVAMLLGNKWWNVEAADYAAEVYRPLELRPTLNGNLLTLEMADRIKPVKPGRELPKPVTADSLLLDHGKVMHLYAIREPEMDAVFHLHPAAAPGRNLRLTLPTMPAGVYKLYGDVVLENGFPETLTSTLTIPPGLSSAPLAADDASAMPPPLSSGKLGPTYRLPDGYTMVWDRPANLSANAATMFRFTLLDAAGKPAEDVQPYLGMAGHAAFVKTDGSVFAHTHPDGSAAMPAMMLANGASSEAGTASGSAGFEASMSGMPGMQMSGATSAFVSPVVEFPYGFPSAGRYRIFIQIKHGGVVETGVFDADAR